MKKKTMLSLLSIAVCFALCGCSVSFSSSSLSPITYADSEAYTAGGATLSGAAATISAVNISWISGKVEIVNHDEDTVSFSEAANQTLTDALTMRYWLDESTLRIQFCASGQGNATNLEKTLTLALPASLKLDQLTIQTTSSTVVTDALSVRSADVGSTSGSIKLSLTNLKTAVLGTTSGRIALTVDGDMDSLSMGSTSGELSLMVNGAVDTLDMGTTSGSVTAVVSSAVTAKLSSTSGDITLTADRADKLELGAVSGSLTLRLPQAAGFTATVSTVSGNFSCGLAAKQNGNTYTCGDGATSVNLSSTSGSITIEEKK